MENSEKIENWLPIPDFPGYDVSDQGRVRSYHARGRSSTILDEPRRILKPVTQGRRAAMVTLKQNMTRCRLRVCSLVLLTFVGVCPPGMTAIHIDSNVWNDRLSNLRYSTRQSKQRSPDHFNGNAHTVVVAIRKERAAGGVSLRSLAKKYGRTKRAISLICRGDSYAQIGGPRTAKGFYCTRTKKSYVVTMRQKRADGASLKQLASDYSISVSYVSLVVTGKRYPHWPGPLTSDPRRDK